jgi:hypothetical protein
LSSHATAGTIKSLTPVSHSLCVVLLFQLHLIDRPTIWLMNFPIESDVLDVPGIIYYPNGEHSREVIHQKKNQNIYMEKSIKLR